MGNGVAGAKLCGLAGAALASLCLAIPAQAAEPLTLNGYLTLKGPKPTEHIAYGPARLQYIELFEPKGPGPFPVVVLIHGGCFQNRYQGMPQMRGMAGALAAKGVAVWSIEYRGLDTPGGGYPGTFLDVRSGLDLLAAQAEARHLDTRRLVVVGHSAGAILGLWAAGREKLPRSSPLYEAHPLPIRKVVALGGAGDLRAIASTVLKQSCGVDVRQITGSPTEARPDVYADTNAFDLTPNGSETVFINGDHDEIVTPKESADYAARVRGRGDAAETLLLPGSSHFDEVAVTSPSWRLVERAILKALGMR
ncbi:MAG TPA: alpha/beta hydrolase [Caulobacteraceae bacterium]